MKSERHTPEVTALNRPQFDYAAEDVLALQRCRFGHGFWFPPSPCCPTCLSTEIEWAPVSGHGVVWSWVVMHQPYFSSFADELPYVCAIVRLAEGPTMVSTIVGAGPDDLTVGLPVRVEFERMGADDLPMPVFSPHVG